MIPKCGNCRHCERFEVYGQFVCQLKGEQTGVDRSCGRHQWAEDEEIGRREVEWGVE